MDTSIIEQNFSKHAYQYEKWAQIQQHARRTLHDAIPSKNYNTILDIGCATGEGTTTLAGKFPNATVHGTDISHDMVHYAKQRHLHPNIAFIHGDFETILLPNSYDLIISNATFQWMRNYDHVIQKLSTHLTNTGIALLSVFGPLTFQELNTSINTVMPNTHPLIASTFANGTTLYDHLSLHFSSCAIRQEQLTHTYPSLMDLLQSIKYTGTASPRHHRGLWTPRTLRAIESEYRKQYGQITATYQVFYLTCTH